MSENLPENKIGYLTTAIADAQELIRFIDTKTAIVITILSAYVVTLFISAEKALLYWEYYGFSFKFFLIIFLLLLTFCMIVTLRIIRPTNNPTDNINLSGEELPNLPFFVTPNKKTGGYSYFISFRNSSSYKLDINFKEFMEKVGGADNKEITRALSFELLKVSFIRNIKNDRFNILIKGLIITTILFIITYLIFNSQTYYAVKAMEKIKEIAELVKKKGK